MNSDVYWYICAIIDHEFSYYNHNVNDGGYWTNNKYDIYRIYNIDDAKDHVIRLTLSKFNPIKFKPMLIRVEFTETKEL